MGSNVEVRGSRVSERFVIFPQDGQQQKMPYKYQAAHVRIVGIW